MTATPDPTTALQRVVARAATNTAQAAPQAPAPVEPVPAAQVDAPDVSAEIADLQNAVADLSARLEVVEGAMVDDAMAMDDAVVPASLPQTGALPEPLPIP